MKKTIFTLLLSIIIPFQILAQDQNIQESQIHLKNGKVVSGKITERNDDNVTISLNGTDVKFATDEINYISHDGFKKKYDKKRFRGFIDFAYGIGVGSPRDNVFSIETSFGYQFSHYLYVGAGIAVDFHSPKLDSYPWRQDLGEDEGLKQRNDPDWKYPFVPFYVNVRSQLYEGNRFTPYADLKLGYSFLNYNGIYCNPTIGIHIPTKGILALNVGVGLNMQRGEYKLWTRGETPGAIPDGSGSAYLEESKLLTAITFKLGIEF